jgi:hypothetical protein
MTDITDMRATCDIRVGRYCSTDENLLLKKAEIAQVMNSMASQIFLTNAVEGS